MSDNREQTILRVIWFTLTMVIIVELPHVLSLPFRGTPTEGMIGSLVSLLAFPLMYLAVVFFLRWEGDSSMGDLGVDFEDKQLIPHLGIGGVTGALAVAFVFVIALIGGGQTADLSAGNIDTISGFIMIAIPVAFLEELCYRGYLMTRMENLWGQNKAILISSVFFSLVHFNWWSPLGTVPPLMILLFSINMALGGIVLGLGYYLSGRRLWVPIGFHFAWNVLAYALFPSYPRNPVVTPEIFQIEWGVVSLLGFLFGLSLIFVLLGTQRDKKKQ